MTTYPGGKSGAGVYQQIINQMPPHRVYIEPFLGGGAIMRLKRPACESIGIDADGEVISAWSALIVPPNLTVLQGDALSWLPTQVFSSDTLIYLDPPYLMGVRSSQRPIYRCELEWADHVRLLEIVMGLRCMVMISGYWSDLYAKFLETWRTVSFPARTRGGRMATEWLWMNFPEPLELHDYRYLGCNFRERERIKRKKARWLSRLAHMDVLERHAMMSALSELRSSLAVSG